MFTNCIELNFADNQKFQELHKIEVTFFNCRSFFTIHLNVPNCIKVSLDYEKQTLSNNYFLAAQVFISGIILNLFCSIAKRRCKI